MDGNIVRADERDYAKEHENEPQVYRCGWCGTPTDEKGITFAFESEKFNETVEILNEHGDKFTKLTNGDCCPNGHD